LIEERKAKSIIKVVERENEQIKSEMNLFVNEGVKAAAQQPQQIPFISSLPNGKK